MSDADPCAVHSDPVAMAALDRTLAAAGFLAESQARAGTIGRMVAKAVQPDEEAVPSFGGCYVVAQSAGHDHAASGTRRRA